MTKKALTFTTAAAALFLMGANHVVVPSKTLETIAAHSWKVNQKKLEFIPNGVDLSHLKHPNKDHYQSLFSESDAIRIGTLARIRKEKNIVRLIYTFEQLVEHHNIELWIAGDGPQLEEIRTYAQTSIHRKRIHLTGNIESPADFICHLDIFALSSDTEQMPYSILEAAGAGLPIVSVDVGDVKSLVANENRPFIQGKTSDELVRNLSILLKDSILRKKLAIANQQFCQRFFDQTAMISRYQELIDNLIH